jgi:hypothetical protein
MMCKALLALTALVIVALAACEAGEVAPTATPPTDLTPSRAETPSSLPLQSIGGVPVEPLEIGEQVEFPDDVALLIETGCYNCDGPTEGLLRVYRSAAGEFNRDTLLAVEQLGLGPREVQSNGSVQEEQPYFTEYVFSPDALQAVVGVCTAGMCLDVGGPPSADAQTTLFRSGDGGVTWEQLTKLEGAAFPLAIRLDGVVAARFDTWPQFAYEIYPTGEAVEAPADVSGWPVPLPDGEILWPTADGRILRSDGSVFLNIGGDPSREYQVTSLTTDPAGENLLFALVEVSTTPDFRESFFLFTTDSDGNVQRALSVDFLPWLGAWLGPDLFLGNADIPADQLGALGLPALTGPMPVLLDIGAGVARPITEPFADPDFPTGRNFLVEVQR